MEDEGVEANMLPTYCTAEPVGMGRKQRKYTLVGMLQYRYVGTQCGKNVRSAVNWKAKLIRNRQESVKCIMSSPGT